MTRRRLNFLLSHREAVDVVVQRGLEQPMHDDIGITSNRTREVSVVWYVQREVLPIRIVDLPGGHVLRRPHGVHQRLGHALYHELVVAIATYLRQGLLQGLRIRDVDVEVEGLLRDIYHLLHPPLERWGVVAQQRPSAGVGDQALRHEVIGDQHVLLDQAVGITYRVGSAEPGSFPVLLELEGELDPVERQGPVLESQPPPRHGDSVHQADVRRHPVDGVTARWPPTRRPKLNLVGATLAVPAFPVDYVLSGGVVEPRARLYDRAAVPDVVVSRHRTVHIHPPDAAECEPLDVLVQAASDLAKRTREHGYDIIDKVHRRCPPQCLRVDGATGPEEVGHVGDVHPDLHPPVREGCNV